jgi:hypothetical protein
MADIDDLDLHDAAKAHTVIYKALKASGFAVDDLVTHATLVAKSMGLIAANMPPGRREVLFRQIGEIGTEVARRLTELYGYPPKFPPAH